MTLAIILLFVVVIPALYLLVYRKENNKKAKQEREDRTGDFTFAPAPARKSSIIPIIGIVIALLILLAGVLKPQDKPTPTKEPLPFRVLSTQNPSPEPTSELKRLQTRP